MIFFFYKWLFPPQHIRCGMWATYKRIRFQIRNGFPKGLFFMDFQYFFYMKNAWIWKVLFKKTKFKLWISFLFFFLKISNICVVCAQHMCEAKSLSYFFPCTFVFSIFTLSFSSFVMSYWIESIQERRISVHSFAFLVEIERGGKRFSEKMKKGENRKFWTPILVSGFLDLHLLVGL